MLCYSEYSFDYSYIFNNVKYEERGVDIYDLAKSIINNRKKKIFHDQAV
jgi:hypothetical protein